MRIAVAQVDFTPVAPQPLAEPRPETPADRCERVLEWLRSHSNEGPFDLVVLPELWLPGGWDYTAWPAAAEDPTRGKLINHIGALAREWNTVIHAGSIIESERIPGTEAFRYYNTSVMFDETGEPVVTYRKIHRFGHGTGESAVLTAGSDAELLDMGVGTNALTCGLATCYDLRFPELFREYQLMGAEAFIIPSSWPLARIEHWDVLLRARAIENQALVIACNTAGTDSGVTLGGHSAVIAPDGSVLAQAGQGQEFLVVDFDLESIAATRAAFPVLQDRRIGLAPQPSAPIKGEA